MTREHDTQRLARIVNEFCDGWTERIEYLTRTTTHTPECQRATSEMAPGALKHHQCKCPKRIEARAKTVRQEALLLQPISEVAKERPATGLDNNGTTKGKPESSPPGSLEALELLADIRKHVRVLLIGMGDTRKRPRLVDEMRALVAAALAAEDPDDAHIAVHTMRRLARRARIHLGYETHMRVLADVTCGECGGALIVADDASSDVRCTGTDLTASCGTVYRRWQWAELLNTEGAAP